jgi:hypothetical protein
MRKLLLVIGVASVTGCVLVALRAQTARPSVEEYPAPLVRERQSIVIGGVTERWELRWKALPRPACEASELSLTCPCSGFAYGEGGDLLLVRIRNGEEIDSLGLTPLFKDGEVSVRDAAILQRWAPNYDTDFAASKKDDFPDVVARRPVVKIMDFIDYDHDGNRSEFYLKTDTGPCGRNVGVVVGISRSDQKLHAFGTVSKPTQPLVLQKRVWEALSGARGPVEVIDWPCGDHAAEDESTIRLASTGGGIDGVRRWYGCPRVPDQRPIREEPL